MVFSTDYLPPEGSDHTRPLYISVGCSRRYVTYVLLDNGSSLNVYPLAIVIALRFGPSDFSPSTQKVRAYDSTRQEVLGTLTLDLLYWLGHLSYLILGVEYPYILQPAIGSTLDTHNWSDPFFPSLESEVHT